MLQGFGAGYLWGVVSGSNQTPVQFGVLQNASVDFKANTKILHGSNQLPVAAARGAVSVTGKAEVAQISPRLYSDLFFGSMAAVTTGSIVAQYGEAGTVPATSTYTITVTNSATFAKDLGVTYGLTGLPLTRVASSPAVGQYSVASGVYTFNVSDASTAMKISYTYTVTSGSTITINNQAMGTALPFITVLSVLTPNSTKKTTLTLNSCISDSMNLNTSLEDFAKQQFTFSAFTDSNDTLGIMTFAEAL